MPARIPRRPRGAFVRTPADDLLTTQGGLGIRVDNSSGNLSMVFFYNADDGGRPIDVTSLYANVDGSGVAIVGWYQGVQGTVEQQAQHTILNLAGPNVWAYQYLHPTDPSTPIMHFGTANAGMINTASARTFRIPAGYSLVVRPRSSNVGISASIIFSVHQG